MAILWIPLAQHVKIQKSSLSKKTVRLGHNIHQQIESSRILDLVIIVDHQLRVEPRHWPV